MHDALGRFANTTIDVDGEGVEGHVGAKIGMHKNICSHLLLVSTLQRIHVTRVLGAVDMLFELSTGVAVYITQGAKQRGMGAKASQLKLTAGHTNTRHANMR